MSNESVTIPGLGLVYTPITPLQVPKTILAPAYIGLDMFNRGDRVYNCDDTTNKVHNGQFGPYTVVVDSHGEKKMINHYFQIVDHHGCPYTHESNTEMSDTAGGVRVRKSIPNPLWTHDPTLRLSDLKGGDVFKVSGMEIMGFITHHNQSVIWWYTCGVLMGPNILRPGDRSWGISDNEPVLICIGTLKTIG